MALVPSIVSRPVAVNVYAPDTNSCWLVMGLGNGRKMKVDGHDSCPNQPKKDAPFNEPRV